MKRAVVALLLSAFALAPTALALADEDDDDDDGIEELAASMTEVARKKAKILAALPSDETALINVARKDLPASPDLLNLGKRATKALARCAADNVDDDVRTICAALLGRIGDRAALPALQGATEAWNPNVRRAAVDALRAIPDPSSIEPLRKLVVREDEDLSTKTAAYRTLGVLSDQRAVKILRDALRASPSPFREVAFEGVWRSRHLLARGTLIDDVKFALSTDDVATLARAVRAAAELRAPELVDPLIPLMEHGDQHVRNRAVWAIGRIGNAKATSALLDRVPKVREARMLNNVAFALERLDAKAFFSTIAALVTHKQAGIRMNAAFVLGDVGRPEGVPMLTGALRDPNDFVRVSAVAALGKLEAPQAIAALEPLLGGAQGPLREETIHAIVALSQGKRRELLEPLLSSKDLGTRIRAQLVLSKLGDPSVTPAILLCVEQFGCRTSEVSPFLAASTDPSVPGRLLLSWIRGRTDLRDLVALKRPAGAASIAASDAFAALARGDLRRAGAAADLVGDLGDPAGASAALALLGSDRTHLRLHGAVALARLPIESASSADGKLLADFDLLPSEWLPTAARAVARIREPQVRARLSPQLDKRAAGPDVPLAIAAAAIRLEWDPEAQVFRFLDALASKRPLERELAEGYLARARHPLITSLLRRALARETRDPVAVSLRRVLDRRDGGEVAR
jgi:HEAT repeat protein